jgi:hypothetical protein
MERMLRHLFLGGRQDANRSKLADQSKSLAHGKGLRIAWQQTVEAQWDQATHD